MYTHTHNINPFSKKNLNQLVWLHKADHVYKPSQSTLLAAHWETEREQMSFQITFFLLNWRITLCIWELLFTIMWCFWKQRRRLGRWRAQTPSSAKSFPRSTSTLSIGKAGRALMCTSPSTRPQDGLALCKGTHRVVKTCSPVPAQSPASVSWKKEARIKALLLYLAGFSQVL